MNRSRVGSDWEWEVLLKRGVGQVAHEMLVLSAQAGDERSLESCLPVMAIKIWYWIELQKNTIVRELKRLELLVARLSQK